MSETPLFLRALKGEAAERPPVWLMRQAGRILPQYRAVRERLSGFKELVQTPDLAAEVTLQPVDELGVDAAILFSDILVVPEAMGLDYELVEKVGPRFPRTIQSARDVERLRSGEEAADRLGYVYAAIEQILQRLDGRVPLIGFSGAPWTLLAYMVEGKGSKTFSRSRALLWREPALAQALLDKITETVIAYLRRQVAAGAQALQLFDSWAGMLSPEAYRRFCLPGLKKICASVSEVPLILFAKGAWFALEDFAELPCALGLDWHIAPDYARRMLGKERVLQGNLDPCVLFADAQTIERQTLAMLRSFGPRHIANLGHGVYPDTPLEGVKTFVRTVQAYRYPSSN